MLSNETAYARARKNFSMGQHGKLTKRSKKIWKIREVNCFFRAVF